MEVLEPPMCFIAVCVPVGEVLIVFLTMVSGKKDDGKFKLFTLSQKQVGKRNLWGEQFWR